MHARSSATTRKMLLTCSVPCGMQLSEEDIAAKQAAVHRSRSMFIYGTQPQHPPSASDIALEMMCTYVKYGVRD